MKGGAGAGSGPEGMSAEVTQTPLLKVGPCFVSRAAWRALGSPFPGENPLEPSVCCEGPRCSFLMKIVTELASLFTVTAVKLAKIKLD